MLSNTVGVVSLFACDTAKLNILYTSLHNYLSGLNTSGSVHTLGS